MATKKELEAKIAELEASMSKGKKSSTGLTAQNLKKISKTTKSIESLAVDEYQGWITLKKFGFKTGIKATPADKKTGMRDIYLSKKFENTRDGWDNFIAEVEAMKDDLDSTGALYN